MKEHNLKRLAAEKRLTLKKYDEHTYHLFDGDTLLMWYSDYSLAQINEEQWRAELNLYRTLNFR